jgi:hypothetical protein
MKIMKQWAFSRCGDSAVNRRSHPYSDRNKKKAVPSQLSWKQLEYWDPESSGFEQRQTSPGTQMKSRKTEIAVFFSLFISLN